MQLSEISQILECELKGSGELEITGVAGLEEAGPQDLTFLSNPKYARLVHSTGAGAILLSPDVPLPSIPALVTPNPYLAFAKAIEIFYAPPVPIPGIHPSASISDTAVLGPEHSIGAGVVIGEEVRIGARATIHPNVTIYPGVEIGDDFVAHSNSVIREHCRIGNRVILQNGAIIGADGFGFAPRSDRSYYKIVQSGIVVLEDDVEIGACSCVDRATVGETRIGRGTKIDNLVQVGHGSRVGEDSVFAAQVGLAGSSKVQDRVMLGGQVGVAGHLTIESDVVVYAQSGIGRNVRAGSVVAGSPEMDADTWKKNYILMASFPELVRTVKRLEKELQQLQAKRESAD